MTETTRSYGRSWRAAAATAIVAGLALAPTAYADGCGPGTRPMQAETLSVQVAAPPRGLALDGVTKVTVTATRDALSGADAIKTLAGSHVSVRVTRGKATSFADGTLDASGRADVRVDLNERTAPGPAVLSADVWSDATPSAGCLPTVREHGRGQADTRVIG